MALEQAIQFDRLVSEISADFLNLRAADADAAIEDALRRILVALDLDRGTLFQLAGDQDFVMTHHWSRPGLPQAPTRAVSATEAFPWSLAKVRAGRLAAFSTLDEVPDAVERESLRYYDTKSRLALPVSIGGHVTGALSFAASRRARTWPREVVGRLRLVASVFGSALALRQADNALRASEGRFHTLCDHAPVLIWTSRADQQHEWFNREWLDFVGRALEQEVGDGWERNVHPDDLGLCRKTYAQSRQSHKPFSMEYRLRRHDGEWRWVLDTGVPHFGADGAFAGYLGSCVDITDRRRRTGRGRAAARPAAGRKRLPARAKSRTGSAPASSSARARAFAACWRRSSRWRPPTPPCCCSAKPAPARSCSPRGFTN